MKYRPEIDGLRAVAVLLVILFHAGFSKCSGGFVGVDVFFVISGYLITSIILKDLEAGTFNFWNFYERRARRILPALFFVIICCIPFAWIWMMPMELKGFATSVVAICVFASNILFWRQSGYFDTAAELKPLLHTWSLAVEEQFYIFFPIAMLILWRFGRKNVVVAIALVAVVSLALSEYGSRHHPSFTFYWLPTRAWELAAGSLCAFVAVKPSFVRDNLLSVAGFFAILVAVFYYDETTPFPSLYALLPVLGTCAIILFAQQGTLISSLLSLKLFVGIGLISYSAYLWHQPLFAFARIRSLTEPSDLLMATLAIASIVLAYFSWRYIEVPARKHGTWPLPQRSTVFAISGTFASLLLAFGLAGHLTKGFESRFNIPDALATQFSGHQLRKKCDINFDRKLGNRDFCVLGAENTSAPSFAVFGDSHSNAMNPLFDSLAKELGLRYVHLGLGGCLPLLGVDVRLGNYGVGICEQLARKQFDYVKAHGIRTVILIGRWSLYTQGEYDWPMKGYFLSNPAQQQTTLQNSRSVFVDGFQATLQRYADIGVRVIVLLQAPQQTVDPQKLYYSIYNLGLSGTDEAGRAVRLRSVAHSKHLQLQSFNRDYFKGLESTNGVTVINPDDFFCSNSICALGDANYSYYRDDNHLTLLGASMLRPAFYPLLK